jgi:hypothetical protein
MAGHVFIVRADIRKLDCDAWCLPCSQSANPTTNWFLDDYPGPRKGPRFPDGGARTQPLPGAPAGQPQPWLTRVGSHSRPVRWYVDGAVEFLDAAANDIASNNRAPRSNRFRSLLALPIVGTGRGGAAHLAGEVVRELLPELEAFARRSFGGREFDVALVCWDAPSYAAAQAERSQRDFWPADLTPALRREAEKLATLAADGKLALFLGAGVSVAAGLPSWGGLLAALAGRAGMSADEQKALDNLRSAQDQATVIERRFEDAQKDLGEAIGDVVGARRHYALPHALLAALPVREAITTNYDRLFDDAWGLADPGGLSILPGTPAADARRWLVKMHGCLSDPDRIVLTRASYTRYDDRLPALAGLVQAFLVTRHVLFVGFSLTDDNFHRIVDAVRRLRTSAGGLGRLGTTLTLGNDGLAEVLWERDVHRVRMDDRPLGPGFPTAGAARRLEVFLDYLLSKARDTAYLLVGERYDALLTPGERILRDALAEFVRTVSSEAGREVRGTVAWPQIERLLTGLGLEVPGD